ncbi:MAG TPA: glycine cleavage T C-terminal barrel domain-containing protein [Vicinamibacterales bacterium]|nr:glycine cleavage T C-terminal barrel domain-containing protein [Vicinamibacterales bacterium]
MKQDNSSGYAALRSAAGLIERQAISGRILVKGADRRSYLQGLLTNDIEALTPGTGCYAAMLNAQGRMLTDMRVLEIGDAILLDVPREVASAIRDHLDRFVFSEDVQVDDVSASRAEFGIYGPRAKDVLIAADTEGDTPSAPFASTRVRIAGIDTLLVRSDEPGIPGYDLIGDPAGADIVRAALERAGAVRVTSADVETVRIESGRPRFGIDMDGDTIPLEAGIEDRAISRTKGCYVGQEVIVRVIDRGHGRVARRLVGLTFDAAAPVPAPGARMTADTRDVGRITSAVWSPSFARPIALGYVHRDFVEPGTRVNVSGAAGIVCDLPFAVTGR